MSSSRVDPGQPDCRDPRRPMGSWNSVNRPHGERAVSEVRRLLASDRVKPWSVHGGVLTSHVRGIALRPDLAGTRLLDVVPSPRASDGDKRRLSSHIDEYFHAAGSSMTPPEPA